MRDIEELGVDENPTNSDVDVSSEEAGKGAVSPAVLRQTREPEMPSRKTDPRLPIMKGLMNDFSFHNALSIIEILQADRDGVLMDQLRAEDENDKLDVSERMRKNSFFRKFAAQYSQKINNTLENHYGKSFTKITKLNNLDSKMMEHLESQSYYRRKVPKLFTGSKDPGNRSANITRNADFNLRFVSVPPSIRRMQIYEDRLQEVAARNNVSFNQRQSPDPLHDNDYVHRLKMANYGRWYMDPLDYQKRIDLFNEQIKDVK